MYTYIPIHTYIHTAAPFGRRGRSAGVDATSNKYDNNTISMASMV